MDRGRAPRAGTLAQRTLPLTVDDFRNPSYCGLPSVRAESGPRQPTGAVADDVAIPLMVEAPPGSPGPAGVVPGLSKVIQTAHPGPLAPLGIVLVAGLLSAAALAMRLRVLRSHGGARTSER
jgi:hypothetical protein